MWNLLYLISIMAGGRTREVPSEPQNGGSLNGWISRPSKLPERYGRSLIMGVNRCKVPPQGFCQDPKGPTACHYASLD